MIENLKKTLDKGIDYAFMTKDKIAKAAKDLAKEHNLTREEAEKLLDHLQKRSVETRNNIESSMQDFVHSSLKKMDVPTKEEFRKMEARVKKLESLHKQGTGTKAKKKPVPKTRTARTTTTKKASVKPKK